MAEPFYFLGAAPTVQVQVPTLTHREGVRPFLANPPYARESGWNLLTYERPELLPGPRLHIQNGDRKFIDLQEDGTLTAIGTIQGFLGHGRWDFSQRPLINGLALVEFTYEFTSFYERLVHDYIEPVPEAVRIAAGVRNAHYQVDGQERKLQLVAGPVGDWYGFEGEGGEAPQSILNVSLEAAVSQEAPHLDIARVSYDILRRVYNSFGIASEGVPYTNETHDAIDFAQIRAVGR